MLFDVIELVPLNTSYVFKGKLKAIGKKSIGFCFAGLMVDDSDGDLVDGSKLMVDGVSMPECPCLLLLLLLSLVLSL